MEPFKDKEEVKDCKLDMGRGCEFCSCGEGEGKCAKVSEGCFKLHVTDWLADYPDNLPEDIYEVRFKNTRRGYYQNVNNLPLKAGDIVAVEASPGHDIGIVSLTGDMVTRQMRRIGFNPQNGEFKKIYRKAKPYDIEKWEEAIALEHTTMIKARQIAADMNINMKIGDVEYQGDKIKAIFYYIADERVDFRELIKVFADMFHIRVEMKQIGARQEAGRIGGLGSCGRELCCASWISSFLSVTTNAARTQDISLNPQKLAGQCSKLKCCLIYEYDDYMDARKEFPRINEPLRTADGEYFLFKSDILARTMSFSSAPGSMANLTTLSIERVREIMKLNAKGIKPEKLENAIEPAHRETEPDFVNAIGEDSITRFDNTRNRNKKNRNGRDNRSEGEQPRQERENPRNDRQRGDRPNNNRSNESRSNTESTGGDKERQQNRRGGQPRNDNRKPNSGNNPNQERREGEKPTQQRQPRTDENKQPGRESNSTVQNRSEQRQPRPERKEGEGNRQDTQSRQPQGNNQQGGRKPQNRRNNGPRRDNRPKQEGKVTTPTNNGEGGSNGGEQ